jgi:hypothetical protein
VGTFDLPKALASLVPVLLAAMWWVISSIGEIQSDIQLIRANQMQLISPSGVIVPSPGNAFARQELKEEILEHIHDLQVRVHLLERSEQCVENLTKNLWLVTSLEVLQDTQRNLMWSKHVRVAKKKLFGLERKALVQLVNPKLGNLHV